MGTLVLISIAQGLPDNRSDGDSNETFTRGRIITSGNVSFQVNKYYFDLRKEIRMGTEKVPIPDATLIFAGYDSNGDSDITLTRRAIITLRVSYIQELAGKNYGLSPTS